MNIPKIDISFIKEILLARIKTFAAAGILLFVNLVMLFYLVWYQNPRLETVRTTWRAKRELVTSQSGMSVEEVYRRGTADLQKFDERIPPKRDFTRVLEELFDLAAVNSLAMGNIGYKPAPAGREGMIVFAISLDAAGKYAAVKSFIADISRMREIITIDAMALNSAGKTSETVNLKLKLSLYLKGGA